MAKGDISGIKPAAKQYLQAVYELEEEGQRVVQAKIAHRLGLSPPTVFEGVKRLLAEGHLMGNRSRELTLSPEGRAIAEVVVRRHRLAERMLVDLLHIPWHQCHELAEDWENVIRPEVEAALIAKLGEDPVCPHGNPIPGLRQPRTDLVPLGHLREGDAAVLVRLLEDVELNTDVLRFLEERGLVPPQPFTIEAVAPDGTMTLHVEGRQVAIGRTLAERLWVNGDGS